MKTFKTPQEILNRTKIPKQTTQSRSAHKRTLQALNVRRSKLYREHAKAIKVAHAFNIVIDKVNREIAKTTRVIEDLQCGRCCDEKEPN